ncbi:MAG: virulence RhuM family protein [Bacteroidales bacterium]|nr:virulence RhuM family protein [Bacteroidales bacterium]
MKNEELFTGRGEIVIFNPDERVRLDVRIEGETVWLTQAQMGELFGVRRQAITKHLKNLFKEGELEENSVCSILEHTATDGKQYSTMFYSLDAILSVGYRVNSKNATLFRRWANTVLKDYLLRGYAVNRRLEDLEKRTTANEKKIDFFVRMSLPPVEGIFFEGQIFDAYVFMANLIKRAEHRIILIDNYVDESVLAILDKRSQGVKATIYTSVISEVLRLDVQRHDLQYPSMEIKSIRGVHDRFLIVDHEVYHIGASLKDLGKKLFAFSKMSRDSLAGLLSVIETSGPTLSF